MLAWDRDMIPRPMLLTLKKEQKKAAIDMFKLVQQYMGDRGSKCKSHVHFFPLNPPLLFSSYSNPPENKTKQKTNKQKQT